ncbi:MAG: zinc ribbon domain-containing protein [Anaerolineae bacterium]|nr:zinc ribbon domain-containing protein [Anaerolineae bacterium]
MNTHQCSQCGTENEAGFRFCKSCGAPLATAEMGNGTGAADEARPSSGTRVTRTVGAAARSIGQLGSGGMSAVNIWGPFAGFGERGRHVSWLLNNLGDRAERLRDAVMERFNERQIPGAHIHPRTLLGQGVVVERRPYYFAQRGIATAALYIARFGYDLYVSQVTYVRGAISPLRAILLISSVLFQLGYIPAVIAAIAPLNATGVDLARLYGYESYDWSAFGFLSCCVGPLWALNSLGLLLVALHMFYKFLTIKDPLAMLRLPPNEFQQDDIIALEKAVEETVRLSLDAVGIDAGLMPPAPEYGFRRRLI